MSREQQQDAGKDSSMAAFYRAHGLCPACQGRGEVNRGRQLEPDCHECAGTGLVGKGSDAHGIARPKTQTRRELTTSQQRLYVKVDRRTLARLSLREP